MLPDLQLWLFFVEFAQQQFRDPLLLLPLISSRNSRNLWRLCWGLYTRVSRQPQPHKIFPPLTMPGMHLRWSQTQHTKHSITPLHCTYKPAAQNWQLKHLGVLFFKWLQYTQITTINIKLLNEIRHNILRPKKNNCSFPVKPQEKLG